MQWHQRSDAGTEQQWLGKWLITVENAGRDSTQVEAPMRPHPNGSEGESSGVRSEKAELGIKREFLGTC
jgi:hypothetical protein